MVTASTIKIDDKSKIKTIIIIIKKLVDHTLYIYIYARIYLFMCVCVCLCM